MCLFVPGTPEERGISLEDIGESKDEKNVDDDDEEEFAEGLEVYHLPWLPDCVQRSSLAKVIRIFPGPESKPTMDANLAKV